MIEKLAKLPVIIALIVLIQFLPFPGETPKGVYAFSNEQEFLDWLESLEQDVYDNKGRKANFEVYKKYDNIVVYGSPFGHSPSDWKVVPGGRWTNNGQQGEFRYLGYNRYGSIITNPYFPRDDGGTTLPPSQWNFIRVLGSENTWGNINNDDIIDFMLNQPVYNMSPDQSIKIKDIGGMAYAKVLTSPTWKSGFSVYTEYTAADAVGKRYATFHGPSLTEAGNSVSLSCSIDTDRETYTISSDRAYVDVEVTAGAVASFSGPLVGPEQVKEIKVSFEGSSNGKAKADSVSLDAIKRLDRGSYGPGTYQVTLKADASLQSNLPGDNTVIRESAQKTITLIVEQVESPYITADASADPSHVKFKGGDINVKVNVDAMLNNISNEADIISCLIRVTDSGNVQKSESFYSCAEASASFSFTIPASRVTGDTYTEKYGVYIKYLTRNGTYEDTVFCNTVVSVDDTEPPDLPPGFIPPVANISCNSTVRLGEDLRVSAGGSYDPDGSIAQYIWETPGSIGSLSGVSGSVRYDSLGDKCIDLQVVDNDGLADYASKVVTVVEPKPYVRMRIDGTLKENRKISLHDTTSNPDDYGVASRSWTITAVPGTGAEQDSICLDNPGNLSPHNILIKKAGQYDITLRHRNTAGYEDTVTQRITVAEDRPPVADFSTVTSVTRDPSGTAYIILNDHSYSPDSDIISQRKWTVRYDSNNNGSFDDETAVVIDNGNSDTIRYETGDVGKYLFELEVKETFGQPAISRFVTESDYMIGNTSAKPHSEKCVEVINIAPVSSFSVAEKSKVDIVVNIENTSHSNSYIQAKINSILIPKLLANNIECCLVVKENRGKEEYNPVYDYVYYMRYIFYTDSNDEEIPVEFRFYKYNIYTGENTLIAYYDLEDFPYDYEYAEMCVIPDGSIYFSNTTNRELVRYKSGFTPVVSWFGAYNYFVRCNKEGLVFHDTYSGISVYNPYTGEDNHLSIREGGDAGNNGKYYGVYSTGGYGSTPYTYYFQEAHPNQENKNILSDCANISVIKASPNGNIYFQENTFESIYEYNPATEAIREALQLESSGGISLVGCGFKNTLYLMDVKNRMFKVYNMDTGEVRDVIEYSDIIRDFRVSPNGNIYFRIVSDIYQYNYSQDELIRLNINGGGILASYPTPFEVKEKLSEMVEDAEYEQDNRFFINIYDNTDSSYNTCMEKFIETCIEKNIIYVGLGTPANKTQVESMVINNDNRGCYIDNRNMDTAMDNLADYILGELSAGQQVSENYLLVGTECETFDYYQDYENDPRYSSQWVYIHDPNYFDNPMGIIPDSGEARPGPYTIFDYTGEYRIAKSDTDNPKDDDRFSAYRKTSIPCETIFYVVRRPVAEFAYILTESGSGYSISYIENSYDLDHTSREDKGIADREWKYRHKGDSAWTSGRPDFISHGDAYQVSLRVKDIDGYWSEYNIQNIDTTAGNHKPAALFTVEPNPLLLFQTATVTDLSSDPDGDEITQRQWELLNELSATLYSGSNPVTNFSTYGTGRYEMRLRVYDGSLWSEWYSVSIEVINDVIPPVLALDPESRPYENTDVTVRITANDSSGIRNIRYKWTSSRDKPESGYNTVSAAAFNVSTGETGVWYLHVIATDNSANRNETYKIGGPYEIDKIPPVLDRLDVTSYKYADGDTYWYGRGDTAVVRISSLEQHSGMHRAYLRLAAPDGCEAYHDWSAGGSHIEEHDTSPYLDIVSAKETYAENGIYEVQFNIECLSSSESLLSYRLYDNCANNGGWVSGGKYIGIDADPPQLGVTPESRSWEPSNVTVHVTIQEIGSGIRNIKFRWSGSHEKPTDGWNQAEVADFDVSISQTGRWYLHIEAVDNVGNSTYGVFGAYEIDKVPPQGTHSLSKTSWTNEDVIINVSGIDLHSGMHRIRKPDGTWAIGQTAVYTATQNGVYDFILEDNVGLRTEYPVPITNIDKINPAFLGVEFSGYDRIEGNTVYVKTSEDFLGVKIKGSDDLSKVARTYLCFSNDDDTAAYHDWNIGPGHLDEFDKSGFNKITGCVEVFKDETTCECAFSVQPLMDNTARVYVCLTDNAGNYTGWIDTGYDVVFFSNRAPSVDIIRIQPDPVYEGDYVTVVFMPGDPDLDPLNITVELTDSDGNELFRDSYVINPVAGSYQEGSYTLGQVIPIGESYRLSILAEDPYGETAMDSTVFDVSKPEATAVSIEGYWNHWRGQVDLFGRQMTVEPHRFLSLETVKINIFTTGYADKVVIRFSPELEAMQYTDPFGHTYDYVDDFTGMERYVYFPQDSTFMLSPAQKEGHVYWEYLLPLAPSTVDWDDNHLRPSYSMNVFIYKGDEYTVYTIDDIDITGNVYDLVYIQPVN